jgi:thiol-disulfide isomerase/thioredoxin
LDIEASLAAQTSMKNPNGTFEFACSSLEGEPVRHTDERFRGKALVVDIMGTWCHNCLDEAPVLQQLEEEFQKDGFEVVGLSFEVSDDPAIGTKNLNLYRERFDLTYTLLFCGGMDDANLDARLKSQLNNFFAFPTTLFIDKGGKVRTIHAGFRGPGTGELYPAQVQKLYELAGRVLSNQF